MTIEQILKSKAIRYLSWVEPWPAIDSNNDTIYGHVTLRATVQDCINMQRAANNKNCITAKYTDLQLLNDFIIINWAKIE